ncbi:Asp23/Gls24 family envelope stress response protein [Streptomyces roseus]|uniref:Alkaline shock protein 23 n=1 Tax=Streptomyces roseus TaxID=66430 RepID=A0A0J7A843_9ACTN|nr:Asp23/Gls24 family envelope stress response protein [Streptomyces roseus]KMO93451.1 hypothetical protein ACS04_34760 [Streptomyces roseus]
MSDTINPTPGGAEPASSPAPTGQVGAGTAPHSRGRTTISDSVVEKIVGMATREIPGIHSLGAGMARTIGAVKDMVPGGRRSVSRGVKVEVGERQTAVDLDVVVEYGVAIVDLAGEVRRNVISAVERMTGLEVVEVNITVDDVHLPDEEDDEDLDGTATRVQ